MKRKSILKKAVCLILAFALSGSMEGVLTAYAADGDAYNYADGAASGDTAANTPAASGDTAAEAPPAAPDANGDDSYSYDPWGSITPDYDTPSLNVSSLHLIAGGNPYQLRLENAAGAVYALTEGEPSAVVLSGQTNQSVTITPAAAGQTVLTVAAVGYDGRETVLTCRITVSKLSLEKQLVEIYMNDADTSAEVAVQGINWDAVYYGSGDGWDESLRYDVSVSTQCAISVGNDAVAGAYFSDGAVHIDGRAKGVTNVRGNIYGKAFSIKVRVYHYTLNKYTINTYLGSAKKTLKIKGTGGEKAVWTSGKQKVATVSKKGVVTIKGIGTTKITAKVNGRKVVCIVSVCSKTAYRAVKEARAISKKKNIQYSQAYRMSANYYDCSSLVWRCYKKYGIRFGASASVTWAPTAAEEGRWCANTKHVVASGPVDILSCKLVPGDTIYYAFNDNNGRYLNIDHTAMFAGYEYEEGFGYYGTVLEASSSNNSVVERMYYAGPSIKLIGRPSKK